MLGILTRALFYTVVFNAGIIIGGVYTPDVVAFTRSLGETAVDDSPPAKGNRPKTKQRLLVRTTV